jgi:hypothetical protein
MTIRLPLYLIILGLLGAGMDYLLGTGSVFSVVGAAIGYVIWFGARIEASSRGEYDFPLFSLLNIGFVNVCTIAVFGQLINEVPDQQMFDRSFVWWIGIPLALIQWMLELGARQTEHTGSSTQV